MSQPPSQDPWSSAPHPPSPGAAVQTPGFAVPAQPLEYVMPQYAGRPGLITAIGVISIVIASLSIIYSLVTVLQAAGYYMMSVMSATVAASQARAGATTAAPPIVLPQSTAADPAGTPPVGAQGMNAEERAAAVRDLSRLRPLLPSRKRQLDAILAAAGKDMGTDNVSESGTMPDMRSGEAPPEYFLTGTGRLELFNDRAVFYPSNGAKAIRASAALAEAPPPDQPVGAPEAPKESQAPDSDTVTPSAASPATAPTATAPPATAPTATGAAAAPAVPGGLTPAEIQQVVQQAQSLSGNALNASQATSLQTVLSTPGQQLVQPGGAQGAVVTAYAQPNGPAVIQFADGGSVTLGPQGAVTAMTTTPVMPTFTFQPLTLGLMVVTAVASLALAVYLLVCGIMTLRQSPRARRLHLIYAVIKVPLAITAGLAAAWAARDLMSSMAGGGVPVATTGYSLFSGLVPVVLGCAYPVALLIALNLRSVRDYYAVDGERNPGGMAAG